MAEAIRTTGLTKRYRAVEALHNVNLAVPATGCIYGLVGPNGAGKTTLIKVLMNVLRPTTGYAEVLGMDSTEMSGSSLANVGYVSENQDLPGWMTVEYFLRYLRPFYPTWDRDTEAQLVRRFDLPMRRRIRQLSRGMQMKVALASSLAYRPRLMILDEPFSGLDPVVRDELTQILAERAHETTIFVSSHDLSEVEAVATHIGYLDGGELKFSEPIGALVQRFRAVEVWLAADSSEHSYPRGWIQVCDSGAKVQFVTEHFDEQETRTEIQRALASITKVEVRSMSLREIFLAMARNSRPKGLAAGGAA